MAHLVRVRRQRYCLAGMLIGIMTLSSCDEFSQSFKSEPSLERPTRESTATKAGQTTKLIETDVEAPEVFHLTEAGLWDGRPSLGGIWVAHPDVTDPERVIIRNTSNNKFVIGALFRRQRDIPGPRIQASSDAAAALGMIAGAPVKLDVTALRRESVPEVSDTQEKPVPAPEATPVPTKKTPKKKPADADPVATPAQPDAAAEKPRKKKKFRLFRKKKSKDTGDITETTLDPIAGAAAAIEAATPMAAKPVTPTVARPAKSSLKRPYVQIGQFNVKANAERIAGKMGKSGLTSSVVKQRSGGNTSWRVIVGPAQSKPDLSALLKKVKKAGFSDAYAVAK